MELPPKHSSLGLKLRMHAGAVSALHWMKSHPEKRMGQEENESRWHAVTEKFPRNLHVYS